MTDSLKHRLEINITRDENSANVKMECDCGSRSGGKSIIEPTPDEIGNVVSDMVRSHRTHVWTTGVDK